MEPGLAWPPHWPRGSVLCGSTRNMLVTGVLRVPRQLTYAELGTEPAGSGMLSKSSTH